MYSKLNIFFSKKYISRIIFGLISLIFICLNYPYLFDFPAGIHFIRQTDTISFTLYYLHKNNFNLFDVGNLNLNFIDGKTACEFPLFYYFYFLFFKCFGVKLSLIRWFSLTISAISIYCLLKSLYGFFKNYFLSIGIVLLIIASSVYRYYSFNYLPDSLAISFTFIGISYFIFFYMDAREKWMFLAFLFLTLAALLKVYYGIYLLLCFSFVFFNTEYLRRKSVITFSLCTFLIVSWYCYSIYYNRINHADYYLTNSVPFWKMSATEIQATTSYILDYWYTKYYEPTIFHCFLVLTVILFIPKMISRSNKLFLMLGLILNIIYFLLFFKQFRDHDYYFMNLIPMLLLITIFAVYGITERFKNKKIIITITVVLLIISVSGFNYTSLNIYRRANNTIDKYSIVSYQLRNSDKFLDSLQIKEDARFVVIGDKSVNGSLVLLNRFGWIYPDIKDRNKIENNLKSADYLVVLSPSYNQLPVSLQKDLSRCEKFLYYNNDIYSLKNYNHR